MSDQAQSRPAKAPLGIIVDELDELLRRFGEQKAERLLSKEEDLEPRHTFCSSAHPLNSATNSTWRPALQQESISSTSTRESASLFDAPLRTRVAGVSSDTCSDASSLSDVQTNVGGIEEPNGSDALMIPCEFAGYSGCPRRFSINEVPAWLNHVIGYHLRGTLPKLTICWFCDERRFTTHSNRDVDKVACFRQRIYHIVEHLQPGLDIDGLRIRPDFEFLVHLEHHGLITPAAAARCKQWSEMPATGVFVDEIPQPSNKTSLGSVVIEKSRGVRSRDRRRNGPDAQQYFN